MPRTLKSSRPTPPTRADRRRRRTRSRLLAAARELFAEQGVGETRIGEITERADVAAGSFYNHFSDKAEIVEALLAEITDEQGALVDELTADIDDPAAVVALAHRHFVRLAMTDSTFGQLVIRLDASHRLMQQALGPRVIRDIRRGIDSGRFKVDEAASAVYASGGALLGTLVGVVDGTLRDRADEVHAAAVLRMLGLPGDDAAAVATLEMR